VDNAAVWGLKLPDAVRKSKCYGGQPSDTTDEAHSKKKYPEKTPKRFEIKMELRMGNGRGFGGGNSSLNGN